MIVSRIFNQEESIVFNESSKQHSMLNSKQSSKQYVILLPVSFSLSRFKNIFDQS